METLPRLRRLVQAIVAFGLFGTAADLLLLAHYEDPRQLIPFAAILIALTALTWHLVASSAAAALAVQLAMATLVVIGATGIALHYRGSMEFKLEADASLHGVALFRQVVASKAPPVLAPANLALLGLLGLASIYRLEDRHDT